MVFYGEVGTSSLPCVLSSSTNVRREEVDSWKSLQWWLLVVLWMCFKKHYKKKRNCKLIRVAGGVCDPGGSIVPWFSKHIFSTFWASGAALIFRGNGAINVSLLISLCRSALSKMEQGKLWLSYTFCKWGHDRKYFHWWSLVWHYKTFSKQGLTGSCFRAAWFNLPL